jgi:hypothetical protein
MPVTLKTIKQEMAMDQKKSIKIELTMDVYEKLVQDAGKGNFAKHISKLLRAYEPKFELDNGLQATLQDILARLAKLEAKDANAVMMKRTVEIPPFDFDATLAAMSVPAIEPSDDEDEAEQQPDTSSIQDEWVAYQAEHALELPSQQFWRSAPNVPNGPRDHALMSRGVPTRFMTHVKQMLDTQYS